MELIRGTFDRTKDHWGWRPGWGPGSRYLTFHLTFEAAPSLHRAAEQIASRLQDSVAVDLVPVDWLHLTMTGVGFSTDLDDEARESVMEAVFSRMSTVEVEPLRFHRAFLGEEGFGVAPRPAAWLDGLKRIQAEAVSAVRDTHHDSAFEPHVSLAYFSGDADISGVEEAVRALPVDDIVVEHPYLSLIELERDNRVYTWQLIHQLALG